MIIGITGTNGAGKGTVVEFLKELGFEHHSVRDFLIEEIKRRGLVVNRDSMIIVANDLRSKNSPSYIVEKLYEKAKETEKEKGKNVVIESLRCPGEVEALKDKGNFTLFAVDAPPFLRYERITQRGEETDTVSYEKFISDERKEMRSEDKNKQNLSKCIEMADYKFENNSTISDLKKEVFETLKGMEILSEDNISGPPKENSPPQEKTKSEKFLGRKDYISWDEYFMGVAILSGKRSKDPSTQVGACIVDEDKKIVGAGYNGSPRGIEDEDFPWEREGDFMNTKYAYVCHAELNAILNSTKETLKGCTLYVALFPCNECAKAIVQSGIKKVVYLSDKYKDTPSHKVSKKILEMSGVFLEKLKPRNNELMLNFDVE